MSRSSPGQPALTMGAVVAFTALGSCGTRAELLEATASACPEAPLRELPAACRFDGECRYRGPRFTGSGDAAATDLVCTCASGRFVCEEGRGACDSCSPPKCPLVAAPGFSCTVEGDDHERPGNAECLLPASSSRGHGRLACACDGPGPSFVCVPLN